MKTNTFRVCSPARIRCFLYTAGFFLFCWVSLFTNESRAVVIVVVKAPDQFLPSLLPPSADLGLSATITPSSPITGGNVVYTLTVTNTGPDEAGDVVLTNTLPPEIQFIGCDAGPNGTCGNNTFDTVTADFPALDVGESGTLVITGAVRCYVVNAAVLTNTAIVGSSTNDSNLANNQVNILTTNTNPFRKPICTNTITFTETFADRVVCSGRGFDRGCGLFPTDAFTLKATISLEGIDITRFNDDTQFELAVGDEYDGFYSLGADLHYTTKKHHATLTTPEGDFRGQGAQIVRLKWTAKQLKVTIRYYTFDTTAAYHFPILADQYEGSNGPIAKILSGFVSLGNAIGNLDGVYCVGTALTTNKFFRQIGDATVTAAKIKGVGAN